MSDVISVTKGINLNLGSELTTADVQLHKGEDYSDTTVSLISTSFFGFGNPNEGFPCICFNFFVLLWNYRSKCLDKSRIDITSYN